MKKHEIAVELHRAGLRLDDAHVAAGIIQTRMRSMRDKLIVAASKATALSNRRIAELFGVDEKIIRKVLARGMRTSSVESPRAIR